jgi:short chain dehydrogenase
MKTSQLFRWIKVDKNLTESSLKMMGETSLIGSTGFSMERLALAAAGIGLIVAGSRLLQRKRADLQGQVVLITGSSRGLGLALAEDFAQKGARLVICARNTRELEQARHMLDTLPFTSISARRAARQIVSATQRGSAEVIISVQAQLLARFHGLFPGITADILGVTDRLLPSSQGQGTDRYSGKESETAVTRSFLTALGQKAVKTYNQTTV